VALHFIVDTVQKNYYGDEHGKDDDPGEILIEIAVVAAKISLV
jgi:hypothetical protein